MQLLQKTAGRQSLSQEILAHTLKSVAAAPSLSDPFPHVIVPNLFPSRIYQEMLELLPEQSAYETFAYEKHSTDGESNRFRFSLKRQSIDRLSPRKQVLWSAIRDVFRSPQLKDAMFGKVKKGLAYRSGISEEKVSDLG
ncbi:MAG: hypothetical protein SGJ20_16530, partial [Planctomycetota bacterium]|nr:hypothetical protein [Planctomycetota bacterium]